MIKIDELLPLLRKGYVAMDKDGAWWWFKNKPTIITDNNKVLKDCWCDFLHTQFTLKAFDIEPEENWKTSLKLCGEQK